MESEGGRNPYTEEQSSDILQHYYRRLILEGREIKFTDNLVNLQAGFMKDECWTPFLKKLYKELSV